jgi:hypothetical protein
MSTPRRYEKGVTNIAKGTTMGMFPAIDPSRVYGDFDDFFVYTGNEWVLSETGAGTEAISIAHAGGALVSTNAGTAGDHHFYQRAYDASAGTLVSESFLFQSGKPLWFKARFKVSDADTNIVFCGLYITNTDPVAAAPTDGVYFNSPTGSADLYLRVRKNSLQLTTTKVATLSDLTWITVGYHWDGSTKLHYYIGNNYVDTLTPSTYLPNDEYLAISHGFETEDDVADAMYIDYIGAWSER